MGAYCSRRRSYRRKFQRCILNGGERHKELYSHMRIITHGGVRNERREIVYVVAHGATIIAWSSRLVCLQSGRGVFALQFEAPLQIREVLIIGQNGTKTFEQRT